MKIGLAIGSGEGLTLDEMVAEIVRVEKDGFASAWMAQIMHLDALTTLAMAGPKTSRIELGTAVVPTYPRHPHSLTQQAVTADQATGGRLSLGIGRSHKLVIEDMFGIPYDKPISHMRDYITIMQSLMETGMASVNGKAYRVNAPMAIKGARKVPILVGALQPKMLALCGELCDGTLTWMCGPKYVESEIVPRLAKASSGAGKAMPRVVVSLPVCVTDNADEARASVSQMLAIYGQLPVYRACLDAEGAQAPGDIALIGDEKTVEEGLRRVAAAGASDFYAAIVPVGADKAASQARSYQLLKSFGGVL